MSKKKEVSQDNEIQFDGMFKELMDVLSERNLVQFVNTIFNKDFPLDSKVTRLETESNKTENDDKVKTRRSDIILDIDGYMFSIEAQSSDDSSMVLRMFEYGYRAALQHKSDITDNCLELRFPDPVVIYLRSGDKTPTELNVKVIFPNIEPVEYKIPTKLIGDYTPETLRDGSLFAIAPFYPMKFEKELSGNHDAAVERRFIEEFTAIAEMLKEKANEGEISGTNADLSIHDMFKITQAILNKAKIINREEVDELMESVQKVYVSEPLNWLAQGRAEGRAEGITEGIEKGSIKTKREIEDDSIVRLTAKEYDMKCIIDMTGLDAETIKSRQKELADRIEHFPKDPPVAKKRVLDEREER